MSNKFVPDIGYSLGRGPLSKIFPSPVVAKRAPTANDIGYQLGQEWVWPANGIWFLETVAAGAATWVNVSGGAGSFSSLVVTPGPSTLTGAFTVNSAGNAVNIAHDAVANATTIGNTTGASSLTLQGGTGGIVITPTAGNISMAPGTLSSASASATLNDRLGSITFTGFTTASAGTQGFVITNNKVLATSAIFVTVSNVHNANDAQMELNSVVIAAAGGSFTVNTTNVGAGALDGNVILNFWVIN